MKQYIYKSAPELARMILGGKATSTDIVKAHLDQIKNHKSTLHAMISIFDEEAMKEAALRDEEAKTGRFRWPLHGFPGTIKEQFWMNGKFSNANFNMLKVSVTPEDAVIVDRINKRGAHLK
jgi:Asp-tRNA(Asn)/Glu-tRNA(Gln) amidotransferase A subunit family amidase